MKTKIGVLFGGRSTEHEISVISANQAMHAIDKEKYDVIPIFINKDGKFYTGNALFEIKEYRNPNDLVKKCIEVFLKPVYGDYNLYTYKKGVFKNALSVVTSIDVMVPVLHGANGEDGAVQGLLQIIGIPYAGCDILASANGMDKITMKMILRSQNIPVVDFVWFTDNGWHKNKEDIINKIESELHYPVIVKPSNLGSSVGIGKAANRDELVIKIKEAEKFSNRLIVEKLVEDLQEINCAVLGTCDDFKTSVLEEPLKTGDFLSYKDKYMGGGKTKGMQASSKRIPAELPEELTNKIHYYAGETFRVLGCEGVSRVDVIVDKKDGSVYVNEINTIPGSLSFYLWEATGISFSELMNTLIKLALRRKREESGKTFSFDQNIFAMGGGTKGAKGFNK